MAIQTRAAVRWTGVNLRERQQERARAALLETFQWAQAGAPLGDALGQIRTLAEYDEQYLDLLVDQLLWDQIGGVGMTGMATNVERERRAAVDGSRQAWRVASPLAQWAVWTWTAWGLGDAVALTAEDEQRGQPILDEFLQADRNAPILGADNLHALSEQVLVDGNVFLAFYASTIDGETTLRTIAQDEIEIVANPADALVPWFYKRTFNQSSQSHTLYYPDWALYFSGDLEDAWRALQEQRIVSDRDERADLVRNGGDRLGEAEAGTAVCVLHVAHNRKVHSSLWGWPMLSVALPWARSHKRFAQARLTVALNVAQFVRRSRVSGGSRAVDSVIETITSNLDRNTYLDTNPPAARGAGWHVENRAVETTELPMRTGAQDAKADNDMFAWIAGLGMGLNTTTMGLDTARYATAVQMDKVQSFLFTRYKTFWSTQLQRAARIVFQFAQAHGGARLSSTKVQVSVDSFSLPDFPDIVDSEKGLMAELHNGVVAGVLPANAVAAVDARMVETALQALGVSDAADLTSDEAFGVGQEQPEQPEQEETPPGGVLAMVARNYADGAIDLDALAENVLAAWAEKRQGD